MDWVLPSIIIVCALGVFAGGVYIKNLIRRFSQTIFGTSSLLDGYKKQKRELSVTPKSISSMTAIYMPLILKDFPDFNLEEFKQKSENMLKSAFSAITAEKPSLITNASVDLKKQITLEIDHNISLNRKEAFNDVTIYKTEITSYKKQMGTCVITLQSAVGYMHYIMEDGKIIEGSQEFLEQTKYNIDIIYIQDISKITSRDITALGTSCPNCGAPISQLGNKVCEYCNMAVEEINVHVWSINRFNKL